MNHSMVSHSFQGKSQLFSWTQKVPHHWGLSLPVFPFLTNAPWQLPRQLHQTAEQFLEHPLFFFFPHAPLTWNILMLQSQMCFLSFYLPGLLLILILQITTQASTEIAQDARPGLLSSPVSLAPGAPPLMSIFHCNLWWLSPMRLKC